MLSNCGPLSAIMFGGFRTADDVFPYEFGDIFVFDASICFSFHPFTEVIRGDEQNFFWAGAAGGTPKVGTCEGSFVQVPPIRVKRAACTRICVPAWDPRQSACPEVPYNVVRPLLAVCLLPQWCCKWKLPDGRVGLHMYRQQYGFFDREGGSYACQGVERPFSVRLIFSIVHSVNRCKTRSLETDRARARSNPDRMASYSASLLEGGTPAGWLAPDVLLLGIVAGALPRILTIGRLHRLAKSTILLRLVLCVGWAFGVFQHEVSHHLAFHGQSGMLRRGWSVSTTTGGLGNRGGASGRHFEELRPLAPSLNTWFLRPPMLC
ncbi:hypothetical protein CK203_113308 [Vitis vinifera]|uniref:Uncharacterized protein n=1 Tax=Vitis vinifera TaxID=29760 RepID=A0A438FGH8_VITVI|nr:hypothetical protein CK203_113308 [Vitis vinifera]